MNGNNITVGNVGPGTFTQNSGQAAVATLYLGNQAGGAGTFLLAGGTLNVNASPGNSAIVIGNAGDGTFIQSGGFLNTSGINVSGFGTSYFRISAGTINNIGNIFIGAGFGTLAAATVDQTGGFVTNAGGLLIGGGGSTATATYNLAGGTLNDPSNSIIGFFGPAVFNQTGGTHNAFYVGLGSLGTGVYNLSGGTFNSSFIALASNGSLTQTGGYLNVGSLITSIGASNHYQFLAGELAVPALALADGGLIGGNFSTLPNRSVFVAGATTLAPFSVLTLNGGTFATGSVLGSGQVAINSGTFLQTASSVTVGNRPVRQSTHARQRCCLGDEQSLFCASPQQRRARSGRRRTCRQRWNL